MGNRNESQSQRKTRPQNWTCRSPFRRRLAFWLETGQRSSCRLKVLRLCLINNYYLETTFQIYHLKWNLFFSSQSLQTTFYFVKFDGNWGPIGVRLPLFPVWMISERLTVRSFPRPYVRAFVFCSKKIVPFSTDTRTLSFGSCSEARCELIIKRAHFFDMENEFACIGHFGRYDAFLCTCLHSSAHFSCIWKG